MITRVGPRTVAAAIVATLLLVASLASAHDLFIKPAAFFGEVGRPVRIDVLNGTFTTSAGVVARNRLRDLSVVGPAGRTAGDTALWSAGAKDSASAFSITPAAAGTYAVSASTFPKTIALAAKDFNSYLAEDGLPDVLARRRRDGQLGAAAKERYSKHVKALVQIGDPRTAAALQPLGYPAELVPLENPYAGRGVRRALRVRALVDGAPVKGQVVLAGGRTTTGARITERRVRTDANGLATVPLGVRGSWYVKFIHMVPVTAKGDSVDYESKWATLVFGVR